jgi:alpha-glucosidase
MILTSPFRNVFVRNPDQSPYIGQVWPGHTVGLKLFSYPCQLITGFQVFPDWLAPQVELWWTEALRNWTSLGVEFSGLWLDMNEVKSFCDGHW